jgi:hypothetical protein
MSRVTLGLNLTRQRRDTLLPALDAPRSIATSPYWLGGIRLYSSGANGIPRTRLISSSMVR